MTLSRPTHHSFTHSYWHTRISSTRSGRKMKTTGPNSHSFISATPLPRHPLPSSHRTFSFFVPPWPSSPMDTHIGDRTSVITHSLAVSPNRFFTLASAPCSKRHSTHSPRRPNLATINGVIPFSSTRFNTDGSCFSIVSTAARSLQLIASNNVRATRWGRFIFACNAIAAYVYIGSNKTS